MFQKLELLLSKPLSSATPSCSFSDDIQPLAKEDLERITFTTDELLKPFDPLNVALDLELEKDEEEELMKVEEQEQEDEKAVDEDSGHVQASRKRQTLTSPQDAESPFS
eukprot:TRINITY_DN44954_c0_g1_i1.p1 TRINITY_DN44954_c0_g1~~TRINITY_DN44954_c0_g1_i1.p1  ORF type:complete len:116 (-),score=38.17 TRINITY_DN44954_c0_g1_i1:82-408(-)